MPEPSCSTPQHPRAPSVESAAIRRRLDRAYVVVLPPDELDETTAGDFRERLLAIEDNTDVVVDLRRLDFCGSAGVRVFLEAHDHLHRQDCTLTLSSPPPILDRVLAACELTDHFTIRRTGTRRSRRLGGADAARR